MGTNFEWSVASLSDNFSVYPAKSYISSLQDAKIDVTFHPTTTDAEPYVAQSRCKIADGEDLRLNLSGMCIAQKPEGEVLEFAARVREEETKSIVIKNTASEDWHIKPVIHSDMWRGPENFLVQANAQAEYPVTYKPFLMTKEGAKHESTIFFPLPNGSGMLYQVAERPLPCVLGHGEDHRHAKARYGKCWTFPTGSTGREVPCAVEAGTATTPGQADRRRVHRRAGLATRDHKLPHCTMARRGPR